MAFFWVALWIGCGVISTYTIFWNWKPEDDPSFSVAKRFREDPFLTGSSLLLAVLLWPLVLVVWS